MRSNINLVVSLKLQLGGVKQRQFPIRIECGLGRHQLEYRELIERPSVSLGDDAKFAFAFRQRDVQTLLASSGAFQKILKRDRGFPGARFALDQVQPLGIEAAAEDIVQTCDSRGNGGRPRVKWLLVHDASSPLILKAGLDRSRILKNARYVSGRPEKGRIAGILEENPADEGNQRFRIWFRNHGMEGLGERPQMPSGPCRAISALPDALWAFSFSAHEDCGCG
jgi:hypothetical protein